ncbi:MAG: ATP-binding protein [Methylococcales bacterium]|nr:ATP-binding protein [Methylococcales bacterium]
MVDEQREQFRFILAAEDCSPEHFDEIHVFSKYEEKIIRSLIAHGPVLIRGGRGSGKSALLIKAHNQIKTSHDTVFSVYLSLRHLPLLRSQGKDYEEIFCRLLLQSISQEIERQQLECVDLSVNPDVGEIQQALVKLSSTLKKRVVLFFDDAAHIGRETSLAEFFDIFRTLSSSTVACKAAIYPGVTKFGTRFDVYNDATVIDIARDERMSDFGVFFEDVIKARYPQLLENTSSILQKDNALAWFLGRTVAGNMRALVFACNKLTEDCNKIELPQLTQCLLYLASDYYWPLLEELTPKLGIYESLIEPSRELAEKLFAYVTDNKKATDVVTSVLIHRDLVQEYAKLFEILEYTGFISRREVSRAMKSGGRGSRYILNLCNLLEKTSGARLSADLFDAWKQKNETSEIHRNSSALKIQLPELPKEKEPAILNLGIEKLKKSKAYPYGLTDGKFEKLNEANLDTIGKLADASDQQLKTLEGIGDKWIQRLRNVVGQAIWM